MRKKSLQRLRAIVFSSFCAVLTAGTIVSIPATADTIANANEFFVNAENVSIKKAAKLPNSFGTFDGKTVSCDFDSNKEGVLLSSSIEGSTVDLAPTFSGDFSMTFRAYSDVSFGSENANEYNSSKYGITEYADLRGISFVFEDENGVSFTVAITAGERWNVITPAARVVLGDLAIGYHYLNDAKMQSDTQTKNSGALYTRIGGTTFCNVARRNGALTSANSMPVTFGYDATEMQVYVMHCGTMNDEIQKRVVLDLDDETTGVHAIKEFGKYNVSVNFSDIANDKTAKVVVYDVNGQSLAGETFNDTLGAETIVEKQYEGVKGEKYYLPKPLAFDLLEGELSYNGTISVNGGNCPIYDADGITTTTWKDNCYFTPTASGEYSISYQAKDSRGNKGVEKILKVNIYEELPVTEFFFEGNYTSLKKGENTYGVGSTLPLYAATVNSELFNNGTIGVNVSVLKGNSIYKQVDKLSADITREIVLEDAGEYTLVYKADTYGSLVKYELPILVDANTPTFDCSISSKIAVGSEFTLPRITAELNGSKIRAGVLLYAPDGGLVSLTNNTAKIEQVGEYKLLSQVSVSGKAYTHTYYFEACHTNMGAFIEENASYVDAEMGDSGTLYSNPAKGTVLTFTGENEWATYSQTIDLSKNTKNDPLVKVMVLPTTVGKLDYWQYTIRLTDVNDAKNYVDILVFKGSWGNAYSYVRAAANNQTPCGWENGVVLSGYNVGTPINYSFTGESLLGTETATFYYDFEDNAVYVDNIKKPGYFHANQIIDLDSTDCFSEKFLFKGFSTGEVKLSISVQYLTESAAKMLVTEVNGVSLEKEWFTDKTAPIIRVDTKDYSENELPFGLINTVYPVFNAHSFDSVDGEILVNTKVYSHYQTANQTEILIVDDGFVPTQAGIYSIVYTAVDKSGNKTEKVLSIEVKNSLEAFDYVFDETIKDSYFLGEYLIVPKGTAIGGSGRLKTMVSLFTPDNKLIDDYANYIFEKEGTYYICVRVQDFLGRVEVVKFDLVARIHEKPIIYEVSVFNSIINGVAYTMPDFEAVDYSTGVLAMPQKSIKVIYNGIETILGADRVYTPSVSNHHDTIQVVYVAENEAGAKTEVPYDITVLNVRPNGIMDMSAYFALNNVTVSEKADNYVEFTSMANGGSFSFVNPLIANNIGLKLSVPKAKNNFEYITITYTDSLDKRISRSAVIYKSSEKAGYSYFACGGETMEIKGDFYGVDPTGFFVRYNNNSYYFFDRNGNKNLDKAVLDNNGDEFKGFPSGKVYITVTFGGVDGAAAIRVSEIANQAISNVTVDLGAPVIQLIGDIQSTAEINENVTVPAAIAADVLQTDVNLTVTISYGSTKIYSGSIESSYTFKPDKFGTYSVSYKATASGMANGRSTTTTKYIEVKDKEKPTLTLNGQVPTEGKVGVEISLPTASVLDNNSTTMRVWIYVTQPNGKMLVLAEGTTKFIPESKGKYTISYYVADEYTNYAIVSHVISVK